MLAKAQFECIFPVMSPHNPFIFRYLEEMFGQFFVAIGNGTPNEVAIAINNPPVYDLLSLLNPFTDVEKQQIRMIYIELMVKTMQAIYLHKVMVQSTGESWFDLIFVRLMITRSAAFLHFRRSL